MLTRNSQIGEFYVMAPPQVKPMGDSNVHTCDMMIYDEESDKHVRVTWGDALAASCVVDIVNDDADAKKDTMVSTGNSGKTVTATEWLRMATDIKNFNEGIGKMTWDDLNEGKHLDIRIVVARPFIEHLMHNVILAVAGRETGATLFGPADMQLSANTQVKTIEGYANLLEHTHAHIHTLLLPCPYLTPNP
mgnify:CR=1 FL=1